VPSAGDENVGGFYVAMDDSIAMSCVERVCDLDTQVQQLIKLRQIAFNAMLEGLALEQFHGNKMFPLGLVNLIDGADVRMIER
jgi:hypothetical protein